MSTPFWYEQFKEKLQGIEEDYASSHSKVSLLAYAFQIERLSSEEYLAWAMAHYQLPKLTSRFFIETPPSQEMFAKWATHYLWSAECLPVAEWDGSLIVACLQPPQDFPSAIKIIPVLATLPDLAATWEAYNTEAKLEIPTAETESVPEGIDLSMATVVHPNKSDAFSFEDLGIDADSSPSLEEGSSEENSDEAASAEEGLEGLVFDAPTTLVKLESIAPIATETEDEIAPEPATTIAPVKSEVSEATAIFKPTTPKETLELQPAPVKPTPAPTPAPAAKAAPIIPPPPQKKEETVAATEEKTTIAPRMPKDAAGTAAAAAVATLPVNPGVKSSSSKPTSNPGIDVSFSLEALKKKNSSLDERVKTTFTEMKNHFEKSMILTLDEKESQLLAFAWDENFKGVRDPNIRVPLRIPSIFNIVASTQKSFHGYISLNEINEKFFEDWNQGRIPDHVTIAPLIVGEKMVGMLMGFAEKSAYNKMSLNLAERLSADFVKNLKAA